MFIVYYYLSTILILHLGQPLKNFEEIDIWTSKMQKKGVRIVLDLIAKVRR